MKVLKVYDWGKGKTLEITESSLADLKEIFEKVAEVFPGVSYADLVFRGTEHNEVLVEIRRDPSKVSTEGSSKK